MDKVDEDYFKEIVEAATSGEGGKRSNDVSIKDDGTTVQDIEVRERERERERRERATGERDRLTLIIFVECDLIFTICRLHDCIFFIQINIPMSTKKISFS